MIEKRKRKEERERRDMIGCERLFASAGYERVNWKLIEKLIPIDGARFVRKARALHVFQVRCRKCAIGEGERERERDETRGIASVFRGSSIKLSPNAFPFV